MKTTALAYHVRQRRRKTLARAQHELQAQWADLGYLGDLALSARERDIADFGLRRANQWVDGVTKNPPRPYTHLFTYEPNMIGNRSCWLSFSLQLEHSDARIYAVSTVSRPRGLRPRTTRVSRIDDHATDLMAAVTGLQELSDRTISAFLSSPIGRRAKLAPYKVRCSLSDTLRSGAGGNLVEPGDNAIVLAYSHIRARLAKGIDDAQAQRVALAEKTRRFDRLADLGYEHRTHVVQPPTAAVTRREGLLLSDADRDRACSQINEAFSHGRLTAGEHERRVATVLSARTSDDLTGPLSGLPRHALVAAV